MGPFSGVPVVKTNSISLLFKGGPINIQILQVSWNAGMNHNLSSISGF